MCKGRPTNVVVTTAALDADKMVQRCLSYRCTASCQFTEDCKRLATDIGIMHHYRTKLFGTSERTVTAATRSRYLFDMLNANKITSVSDDGRRGVTYRYFIDHTQICRRAYLAITGYTRIALHRARKRVAKGSVSSRVPSGIIYGGSTRNRSKDTAMAMAWLRGVATKLGQHLPNADETRLPFGSKKIVHEYYGAEMRLRGVHGLQYARFLDLWANDPSMSKIKLTKRKGTFAQCDKCADFAKEMTNAIDNVEGDDIKRRWNEHVAHVARCREIYYDNRDLAHARPDKTLCIIADIMDQAKTTIPHHRRKQKRWCKMQGLRQCVMGVKTHGVRMDHYVANARVGTGGGANFTIECLSRTFRKIAAMGGRNGKLPPRLYLQMDNCSGDNKNYTVIGYLNWLVTTGVFNSIEVGFLPVGHTHEDIDQGFSVVSRHLRCVDALSLSSYNREVRAAFAQSLDIPDIEQVNVKRDWKMWITQPGIMHQHRQGI